MFDVEKGIAAYLAETKNGKGGWIVHILTFCINELIYWTNKFEAEKGDDFFCLSYGVNDLYTLRFDCLGVAITAKQINGVEYVDNFRHSDIKEAIRCFVQYGIDDCKIKRIQKQQAPE